VPPSEDSLGARRQIGDTAFDRAAIRPTAGSAVVLLALGPEPAHGVGQLPGRFLADPVHDVAPQPVEMRDQRLVELRRAGCQ
jgi:hypothetical protein